MIAAARADLGMAAWPRGAAVAGFQVSRRDGRMREAPAHAPGGDAAAPRGNAGAA
jgi:hypothetical protein